MTVLVFGRTGQVATELRHTGAVTALGRTDVDLLDPDGCVTAIRNRRPDAVINAAAYTDVDAAEDDEVLALRINGDAPGAMARACADLGIPFVHISTDYVFDGTGTAPWNPDDTANPQGAYARTKWAGEVAVREARGIHAILRTSWVFSAHGKNFLKTMLRLGADRDSLRIVADQVGGPTPAADVASACLTMARALMRDATSSGTYHLSGEPDVSWADFARFVFKTAGMDVTVRDIPTSDYPTPAVRPLNSRLDCRQIEAAFGLSRPDWRAAADAIIKELRRP